MKNILWVVVGISFSFKMAALLLFLIIPSGYPPSITSKRNLKFGLARALILVKSPLPVGFAGLRAALSYAFRN